MEEQKQVNSSDILFTSESFTQKHSSDDFDTQPVASKCPVPSVSDEHPNSISPSEAPVLMQAEVEDQIDRKKAKARAAQARYAAKLKSNKERDIGRLKQVSEQVDRLESSKKKMEAEKSALTAHLESKDEMLSILQRAKTASISTTQHVHEEAPCPSTLIQQLSPSTSRQEISLTTTTTTTTSDKPVNTHVNNNDNIGGVIPSQADATINVDCIIQAMINTKVEEIKERHGFFPNNIVMTEAIKGMEPSEYVAHWAVLSLEITGLMNQLDSINDSDDDNDKEKYARTENQIRGCLIKHIPVVYLALKYNPSVFVELITSSKSVVKSGESKEECRQRIIKLMGLTAEQIARAEECVEKFENADDILNFLKVVEDSPLAITAVGGRDTSGTSVMVDGNNNNNNNNNNNSNGSVVDVGNLLGIGSMQLVMEQYLNLTELTGKLELWGKKQLVGVLGLILAMDAIFKPMQRARILTLTAPAFPNLLELMHFIAGKFD
jgi:hypothetical protein